MFNFKNSNFSLDRPIQSYSKVQVLVGCIIRNKRSQLSRKSLAAKNYLNCGCGPNIKPNFINLDWSWRPGIDLCWDVTKGLPFGDGSLAGIYTEHMLEHITFDRVAPLLSEFKRVLKKNGILRIVV